jgi:outer membrane receptor for ferrienterochelin and colicins
MYSAFGAGRLAADGVAVWDELLAFLSPQTTFAPLAPLLANPGADPDDPEIASRLLGFDQEAGAFVPTGPPEAIDPLRATITNTVELGYKGLIADKLSISADVYSTSITDFVGPLSVETPSVFLTPTSVEEFVRHRLGSQLEAGTVTDDDVAAFVAGITGVPTGTVTPDQRTGTDVLVISRNFGDVSLWGADLGFELYATDEVTVVGSLSFVSENCFDFGEDGPCGSRGDITLNAPSTKGSVGVRYESAYSPITLGARMRHAGSFPMNSGAFAGDVEAYTLFDAHVGWALSIPGAEVSLVAKNLLDTKHREFVGAPVLGRLAFVRLTYRF